MADQKPPPELGRGGLTRPVAGPSSKVARLPSIRAPRDLTLGGVRKKTFAPNIPTRRDKVKDEGKPVPDVPQPSLGAGGRGRGKRGERGSDRGKRPFNRRPETIQSQSIFEEGPGTRSVPGRGGSYREEPSERGPSRSRGGGSSGGFKLERNTDEDTKKVLENLLRDDFLADDDLKVEEPCMTPVRLPLAVDVKKEVKKEVKPQIKVKQEPVDDVDSAAMATAAMMAESVTAGAEPTIKSAAQLFTLPVKSEMDELIFLQLPDTLPGQAPLRDDEDRKPGPFRAGEAAQAKPETKTPQELLAEKLGLCSLSDFAEGHIGKLQVHKSGRVKLALGSVTLDVTMGTPASFLQDLVSVRLDGKGGDMTVLGHIRHKLVCTPDFDTLLSLPR